MTLGNQPLKTKEITKTITVYIQGSKDYLNSTGQIETTIQWLIDEVQTGLIDGFFTNEIIHIHRNIYQQFINFCFILWSSVYHL